MIDLLLNTGPGADAPDIALADRDIAVNNGVATAVQVALFTDARAGADDGLARGADTRGHWGDAYTDTPLGSHLWLIGREKITPDLIPRIREYAITALQRGVVEPGIATAVEVDVRRTARDTIVLDVTVDVPEGLDEVEQDRIELELAGLIISLVIRIDRAMHYTLAQFEGI